VLQTYFHHVSSGDVPIAKPCLQLIIQFFFRPPIDPLQILRVSQEMVREVQMRPLRSLMLCLKN